MDFTGAFFNGLLAIIGYVVIFLGVYKVNQIATDIREIKGLVGNARRSTLPNPEIATDLSAEDSAAAYAQSLLRAVHAESHAAASAPHELR